MTDSATIPELPRAPRWAEALRRAVDLVVSVAALLLLLLPMLILGGAIRLGSRGPAVFRQIRAGRNGRPFTLYKFRTMRADADPYGGSPHAGDDPRLTRIGRRLREWSLDELPQLWNVLRGDMTLVGPRPLFVSQIAEWNERQRLRLCVKPGLTGLAQINGRAAITLEEKLDLDVEYVRTRSLRQDAWIVWRTGMMAFRTGTIYERRYSKEEHVRGGKRRR